MSYAIESSGLAEAVANARPGKQHQALQEAIIQSEFLAFHRLTMVTNPDEFIAAIHALPFQYSGALC